MIIGEYEFAIRLIVSAIIGSLIGMEREVNKRPAGRRTHVLVTVGSTLVMLLSTQGFSNHEFSGDPARLAAQVVSGIGFLGAGTILRTGNSVKGLTTAASLWVCACIGLAIGVGYYVGGILTTIIALFSLTNLGKFKISALEKKLFKRKYKILVVQCKERKGLIGDITQIISDNGVSIKEMRIFRYNDDEDTERNELLERLGIEESEKLVELYFDVFNFKDGRGKQIYLEVNSQKGVQKVIWSSEEGKIMYCDDPIGAEEQLNIGREMENR